MRGNASKYPDKQLSVASARSQLKMLLCSCTDSRLAQMSHDSLAATYRVTPKECEYELIMERQRRAARA